MGADDRRGYTGNHFGFHLEVNLQMFENPYHHSAILIDSGGNIRPVLRARETD